MSTLTGSTDILFAPFLHGDDNDIANLKRSAANPLRRGRTPGTQSAYFFVDGSNHVVPHGDTDGRVFVGLAVLLPGARVDNLHDDPGDEISRLDDRLGPLRRGNHGRDNRLVPLELPTRPDSSVLLRDKGSNVGRILRSRIVESAEKPFHHAPQVRRAQIPPQRQVKLRQFAPNRYFRPRCY